MDEVLNRLTRKNGPPSWNSQHVHHRIFINFCTLSTTGLNKNPRDPRTSDPITTRLYITTTTPPSLESRPPPPVQTPRQQRRRWRLQTASGGALSRAAGDSPRATSLRCWSDPTSGGSGSPIWAPQSGSSPPRRRAPSARRSAPAAPSTSPPIFATERKLSQVAFLLRILSCSPILLLSFNWDVGKKNDNLLFYFCHFFILECFSKVRFSSFVYEKPRSFFLLEIFRFWIGLYDNWAYKNASFYHHNIF